MFNDKFQEYQLANRVLVFASNGQVYFACKEAVYSEEVVNGLGLEADAAMLQAAELTRLRPGQNSLWTTYRRGVEAYAARKMSNQRDALDAFTGFLKTLSNERCVTGIPASILDLALLWQPLDLLARRDGFCSWSWVGWIGKVQWFNDAFLKEVQGRGRSPPEMVKEWAAAKGWIVWYSSSGTNCNSPAFLIEGPPWLSGQAPSKAIQERRFPRLQRNYEPTPSLLCDRLQSLEDPKDCRWHLRYLQFWTVSTRFDIKLDTSAVMRFNSYQPESTGNGLRRFLLYDRHAQECGWVLLNDEWMGSANRRTSMAQEFILLSEAQSGRHDPNQDTQILTVYGSWDEFNAMMITWQSGIAERVGLGRVAKGALANALEPGMEWKEILLG